MSSDLSPRQLLTSGRVTLTVADSARILGIDRRTVAAAIARGEIAAVTYGARVLVLAAPLRQQLALPDSSEGGPTQAAPRLRSPDETGAHHEDTPANCHCCTHNRERQGPRRLN